MVDGRLVFEVRGTQLYNKGAELMLRASIDQIRAHYPDAIVCVVPTGKAPYERRALLGLHQKFWVHRNRLTIGVNGRWLPKSIRSRFGLVLDCEVDVVFDASGYSLGDQWSVTRNRQMAGDLRRHAARGSIVVLLPQALGPFTETKVRSAGRDALSAADVVFARDSQSLQAAQELLPDDGRVVLAPDFTGAIGRPGRNVGTSRMGVVLIPNVQMVKKTDSETGARYVAWMRALVAEFQQRDVSVAIVLHDTLEDRVFAPGNPFELSSSVPCVIEEDAIAIKSRLGSAAIVLSSRFHGAVSALSQGVPTFVTSWSHKYSALLADYGVPGYVIRVEQSSKEAANRIVDTLMPQEQADIARTLENASVRIEEQTAGMWKRVFDLISVRHGPMA